MKRLTLIASAFLLVFASCMAASQLLTRIDHTRADARNAREWAERTHETQTTLVQRWNGLAAEHDRFGSELALCRRRTDHLRRVLETLVGESRWTDRVRLPEAPGSWPAWPAIGAYTQPGGTANGD